jgi:preprotein translocase subunit YajC
VHHVVFRIIEGIKKGDEFIAHAGFDAKIVDVQDIAELGERFLRHLRFPLLA